MKYLEKLDETFDDTLPLRVPIQYVIKNLKDFRGYTGTVTSGVIYKNQRVKVLPSGLNTSIENIIDQRKI